MTETRPNRLLDAINSPDDLKGRSRAELKQIADEVRNEVIDVVSVTGGHLGSGLGVVELTVAIHSVFDAPAECSGAFTLRAACEAFLSRTAAPTQHAAPPRV